MKPFNAFTCLARLGSFCLIMLLFLKAGAQHYDFKNISTEEGVPSAKVYRVHQDKKGYSWYLTDKGIARFDGKDWKYFSPADGYDEIGAYHIAEQEDGTLWFITMDFKLYRFSRNRFKEFFPGNDICWITFGSNGGIYALTRLSKVLEIFPESGRSNLLIDLQQGTGYSIMSIPGNKFITATSNGVFLNHKGSDRLILLVLANTSKSHLPPRTFKLRNGHVLITNQEGIYDFDPLSENVKKVLSVENNEIISEFEDSTTNDLWIGTYHGAYRFKKGVLTSENAEIYLNDHIICSIGKSGNGNHFFATRDDGVFTCNFNVLYIGRQEGLVHENLVYLKHNKGILYLFPSNGKIYYHEKGVVKPMDMKIPMIGDYGFTQGVFNIHDSVLFVASNDFYIVKDRSIRVLRKGPVPGIVLWCGGVMKDPEFPAHALAEVLSDKIVQSHQETHSFFLTKYLAKHNVKLFYQTAIQSLGNRLFLIVNKADTQGIVDLTYDGKQVLGFRFYPIGKFISDVRVMSNGTIIAGTLNRGLAFIDGDRIKWVGLSHGLASDYCSKILLKDNMVWVSTNRGISRIELSRNGDVLKISNFTSHNFLPHSQVTDFTIRNDSVYVATIKGLSMFHVSAALGASNPYVFIENIQINTKDTNRVTDFDLPYDQNNIDVFYKSPTDGSSGQMVYKYIVEGLIKDTVYTRSTFLHLGAVVPGNYAVKIWSLNMSGVWNTEPAIVSFLIRKPFWKTTWFIVCIILILAAATAYGIKLYLKNQKRKAEFSSRLIESELRSLRLHMNPHFVFNSLTSLQYYILTNKTDQAETFLKNFSALIRSIMSYSVKGEITLTNEAALLKQYINLELERFKDQFDYEITIDPSVDQHDTVIPSLLIQPFVENAIKYGLTGLDRKGKLEIKFWLKGEELYCTVKDNGHGYVHKEPRQEKFSGAEHISTGIAFTTERIRLLVGSADKEVVTITELFNDNEPAGTAVEIMVPVLNEK